MVRTGRPNVGTGYWESMSDCQDKTKGLVGKLSELMLIQRKPHGDWGGTDGLALGLILEI